MNVTGDERLILRTILAEVLARLLNSRRVEMPEQKRIERPVYKKGPQRTNVVIKK
jgi:hypothetical protein